MKRLLAILLFTSFAAASVFSQGNTSGFVKIQGNVNPGRDGELTCAPESIWGQPLANPNGGFFCDANDVYGFTEVFEDYPAQASGIGSVTIWIGFYDRVTGVGCAPGPITDSYKVSFYGLNAGNPSNPGTLIQSFTIQPASITFAGNYYWDLYKVQFNLPSTVSGAAGWVGISRLTRTDDCIIFWWNSASPAYGNTGKQLHFSSIEETGNDLGFCLGGGQEVPVANWPLLLAGVLIVLGIGIRFYRFRA